VGIGAVGATGGAVEIIGLKVGWFTLEELNALMQNVLIPALVVYSAIMAPRMLWIARRQILESERAAITHKPVTLSDRIEELRDNLASSSSLIDEINAELQLQIAALERMQAEAEQSQRLAALHKEEADAVRKLVATTIESANEKVTRPARRSQRLYFLAGLFVSIPLGMGVNYLYDLIIK
jgi:hypothetical protein